MAITISGNGITSANIADGTITTDDINASDVTNLKSGRKNLIINGAMQVAQRGTSFSGLQNSPVQVLDRWSYRRAGTWTTLQGTITQETDAPEGFTHSIKYTTNTAETPSSGMAASISQLIEGYTVSHIKYNTTNAVDLTVGFWVKASAAGQYGCNFIAQGASSATYFNLYTVNAANTWEYKTITVPGHTSFATSQATSTGYQMAFTLSSLGGYSTGSWQAVGSVDGAIGATNVTATAGATLQVAGVQLEVGDTATDFEHRSYGEELALCQRYYEKIFYNHVGQFMNTGNTQIGVTFSVSKRVSPTVSSSGTIGYSNGSSNYTNATFNTSYYANANNVDVRLNVPSGGFSAQSAVLINNQALSGFLNIDAEL